MTGNGRSQGRPFSSVISSIVLTDVSGVAQTRQVAGWFLSLRHTFLTFHRTVNKISFHFAASSREQHASRALLDLNTKGMWHDCRTRG
jgi:hypothetical protein